MEFVNEEEDCGDLMEFVDEDCEDPMAFVDEEDDCEDPMAFVDEEEEDGEDRTAFVNEDWRDLRGTIEMIIGTTSGIGWEFTIDLAKSGDRTVAVLDRLKALCEQMNYYSNDGVLAVAVKLDVSSDSLTHGTCLGRTMDVYDHIHAFMRAGFRGDIPDNYLTREDGTSTVTANTQATWLLSGLETLPNDLGRSISKLSLTDDFFDHAPLPALPDSAFNTMAKMMAMKFGRHRVSKIFKSKITKKFMQKKRFRDVVSKTTPLEGLGVTDRGLTSLVQYLIHCSITEEYVTGYVFSADSLPGVSPSL